MELLYFKIFEIPGKQLKICNKDFNLEGRYNFSVDSKTKEIDFRVNDSYINDFYGTDIKINSIVGKNGLGKTTLLKFLQYIICKLNNEHRIYDYPFVWWHWCAIHTMDDKLYYSESITEDDEIKKNRKKLVIDENGFAHFDDLYIIKSKRIEFDIDECILNRKIRSTSLYYSPFFEFEEIKIDPIDYIDVSNDYLFNESKQIKEENEQTLPQTINFRREEIKRQISFIELGDNILDESNRFYKDFIHQGISVFFNGKIKKFDTQQRYIDFEDIKFYENFDKIYMRAFYSARDYLKGKTVSDYEFFIARDSFYKRILEILYYNFEYRPEPKTDEENNYRPKIQTYNFQTEDYDKGIPHLFEKFILNLNIGIDNNELFKRIQICVYEIINKFKRYDWNDDFYTYDVEIVKDFLKIERGILEIISSKGELPLFTFDWPNLSTGEKAYLNLFSRIHYGLLEKLNKEKRFEGVNLLYILIDEGSTGFHPQWQKEFLKRLILFTNQINPIKKHFIITSHSPYLLSDLQIEDVISIGESDDYRFTIKNTFGANIHELLADKFYLENTFMGDFAREKIEEIGKELIDEKINPSIERLNEIEKIINIIGEPILKERLEFLLAEKKGVKTKDEIILELKDEIKRLKGN
ncbi:AAA family ATPase [Flavobacterium soli]|uniref:AAA family ATPase n=1 Tax=Flavobacterium soli TaxID=344881 RepID=UPI00040D2D60|nr:AAA family ATPase [Flavobacterium soli]